MSGRPLCPHCGSTRHYAYSKGRRRYRRHMVGNVAVRGRVCPACGALFAILEMSEGTPEATAALEVARNGTSRNR